MPRLHLADDAATAAFGARLATALRPGDLILLDGDLGAGKTALARAVIRTLVGDALLDVPSPSFALVQPYDGPGGPILHADLYRLSAEAEIDELGLFDRSDAIVLVEWPERAPSLAARADVVIRLAVPRGGEGRDVDIVFRDGRALG
ncbi:MAG: tRNA (adenosine(37)-N6)-threonylcarbamoyltransferase complex ATPase subunit type 1 TsaE [Myxococcales bacterium]|nr:MAG: tRNA (adenosine(37)-N6)-threonylcarbamoyltransferase complex ATPase subunit type 1 TsaE [Myxococcales bacterium]